MGGLISPSSVANDFLAEWALRDRQALARDPQQVVRALDEPTQRVLYAAAMNVLDDLATQPLPATEPGELRVTMVARPGEEHRWQMAALMADIVVLQYFSRDPTLEYVSLRDLCIRPESDADHVAGGEGAWEEAPQARSSGTPRPRDETDEILEALLDEQEEPPAPDYSDWLRRTLPGQLAQTLRFLGHLAAVRGPSRVLLTTPDLSSVIDTWQSLRGVYYWEGRWGCCDPNDWVTPAPPHGAKILKNVIDERGVTLADINEVFASYALGEHTQRGHLPLIPSRTTAHAAAVEFYSRFRRVFLASPWMNLGPQVELLEDDGSPDWRPALADQFLLDAFPNTATIEASTFEFLHTEPRLADFRRRLRVDAERVEGRTAGEVAEHLKEVSRELKEAASAAAASIGETLNNGRRNLALTGGAAGLIAGAGFVSFGPVGAIGGGLIAASLTAAIEHRKLDPTATLSGSELALITLNDGRPPGRRRLSGRSLPRT